MSYTCIHSRKLLTAIERVKQVADKGYTINTIVFDCENNYCGLVQTQNISMTTEPLYKTILVGREGMVIEGGTHHTSYRPKMIKEYISCRSRLNPGYRFVTYSDDLAYLLA